MTTELLDKVPEDTGELPVLLPDQEKIMLAEMISLGKKTDFIATQLDKPVSWVRRWRKDPEIIGMVNMMHQEAIAEAKSTIISNTRKASETLVNLMDTGPASVRLAAAKDLLDRVGMKAPDRKQVETTVNVNTSGSRDERMALILEKAERLGLSIPQSLMSQKNDPGVIEGEVLSG